MVLTVLFSDEGWSGPGSRRAHDPRWAHRGGAGGVRELRGSFRYLRTQPGLVPVPSHTTYPSGPKHRHGQFYRARKNRRQVPLPFSSVCQLLISWPNFHPSLNRAVARLPTPQPMPAGFDTRVEPESQMWPRKCLVKPKIPVLALSFLQQKQEGWNIRAIYHQRWEPKVYNLFYIMYDQ